MTETTAIKLISPADAIAEQARSVLGARQTHQFLTAQLAMLRKQWETDNADTLGACDFAKTQVVEREAHLRALALTVYFETGNKAPTPGVGIRVTTRLVYDPVAALEWATKHGMCLQLDVKKFESIARNGAAGSFVTFDMQPQATILTDLAKALEGER